MSLSSRVGSNTPVLLFACALLTLSLEAAGWSSALAEDRARTDERSQAHTSLLSAFDFAAQPAKRSQLPAALREVSGLAIDANGRVLAHADEAGIVTEIVACGDSIGPSIRIGNPPVAEDFEGIVAIGPRLVLITSGGKLYGAERSPGTGVSQFNVVETGLGDVCEIEGLGWNEGEEVLVAGCKEPRRSWGRGRDRSGSDSVTMLKWSTAQRRAAGAIKLPLADISQRTGQRRFRTSAVEWSPATRTYIALAGPESAIIEFTPEGKVVAAHRLNRSLHRQPEGLALRGDSVIMIADEGGNGRATVSCYHRRS